MFSKASHETTGDSSARGNMISKETIIEGNLDTAGNIRVDGKVIGNITTKAKIVLGSGAIVEGKITAESAEIGGKILGTLEVSGLLSLRATALVKGDIITNKLVLEAGAEFNGQCKMGTFQDINQSSENVKKISLIHEKKISPKPINTLRKAIKTI